MSKERPPRGEARRAHLLEAALRIVADTGPEALTHRRVAEEAGLPLAATTYWFASKDEIITQSYELAAARDIARIEAVSARLAGKRFATGNDVAGELAAFAARQLRGERSDLIAGYALWLEAARRPALLATARRWTDAYVALASSMMTAAGSSRPDLDAQLVAATLDGLLLEQLAQRRRDFEAKVLRPALERLIAALLA